MPAGPNGALDVTREDSRTAFKRGEAVARSADAEDVVSSETVALDSGSTAAAGSAAPDNRRGSPFENRNNTNTPMARSKAAAKSKGARIVPRQRMPELDFPIGGD